MRYVAVGLVLLFLLVLFIRIFGIIGLIGIALVIWAAYEWKINRKLGVNSKVPGVIIAIGIVFTVGGLVGQTSDRESEIATKMDAVQPADDNNSANNLVDESTRQPASAATNVADTKKAEAVPPVQSNSVESEVPYFSAKVLEVIDGNTIRVEFNGKEEIIGLLLVDSPETDHPQHGKQPFSEEASNFVQELLTHKTVELERDEQSGPDDSSRLRYYVYLDGKSVQEMLLEKGLAKVGYDNMPNFRYEEKYREVQVNAQKAKVGIWSIENYAQEDGFHPEVVQKNTSETVEAENTSQVQTTKTETTPSPTASQAPPAVQQSNVYYKNCSQARAAGAAPIYRGEPGYRPALDRDNDGIACE